MKNKLLLFLFLIASVAWGQTTVTYDFSATGAEAGDGDAPIALDENIGFSSHKNGGTSNPGIFSGQLRLYQDHNGTKGGSIKIHAGEGVTITKVVVNASSRTGPAGYSVDNDIEVDTWSNGTLTYIMDNLTATDYVEFYNKGNNSSTRTYVDTFEVTYTLATSCEESNLDFANPTATADLVDGTFTQTATSLNATTAITYESSDEAVATVDASTGEVSLVGIGTATITASQEAGEHSGVDYCAGTATYELTVISTEPVLTVSTNSLSFTAFAGGASATEDITIDGANLTGDIALALSGDTNFSINPTSLSSTGGEVTITYTPSATPATHSATLTVSNGLLSEVITLSGVTNEMPEDPIVCGEEDFTNATELPTGNNYGEGTFTGNNDIVWSYHGQSAGDYEIDGNGFLLRRASDSYLEVTIPDGVGEFSFDYRKAYTGGSSRQLELLINDSQVATSPEFGSGSGEDTTVYTFTHTVNVEGEVTVRIKLTGSATTNRHTTIDNISWTCYSAGPATQVATPTITATGVENGVDTYFGTANITLATTTDGATIYYTTDGSEPTTASTVYTTSFDIMATATIKAMAVADDLDDSEVAEKTITITEPATATIPYEEAFDNTLDDWIAYNAEGTSTTWSASTYGATVNGYNNGAADAWLISPKLTSGAASLDLVFDYESTFGEGDLLIKYSTDYAGYGDPSSATWQDLPVITHTYNGSTIVNGSYSETLTTTGDIHLAFVYQQSSDWVRWNIRDLMIDIAPTSAIVWTTDDEWSNVTGPTINDDVVIEGVLFVGTDIASLEAKTLTVASTGAINIESGSSVTVAEAIDNQAGASNFIVESGANLVQINDDAVNEGEITVEKLFTFSSEREQYNFVMSPVEDQNVKEIYDGDYIAQFYRESDNKFVYFNGSAEIEKGKGRAIEEPSYAEVPDSTVTAHYQGKPHNGVITVSGLTNENTGFHLAGNPYPSQLDLDIFYEDNKENIESRFLFWDNRGNEQITQYGDGYNGDHYAKYNALSQTGVPAGTAAPVYDSISEYDGKIPTKEVAVGNGFMLRLLPNPAEAKYVYKNAQRTIGSGQNFLGRNYSTDGIVSSEMDRYWLTLNTPNNVQVMNAVVYFEGGNDEYAMDDSKSTAGSDAIYTLVDDHQLAIQGKSSFDIDDKIQLGYKAYAAGIHTISIYDKEGVFADGQKIFIRDFQTGIVHELTQSDFTFKTFAGEFNDRFEIFYKRSIKASENKASLSNVVIYQNENHIQIAAENQLLSDVEIYDLNGVSVYQATDINLENWQVPNHLFGKGILVVVVKTADGEVVNKKLINK